LTEGDLDAPAIGPRSGSPAGGGSLASWPCPNRPRTPTSTRSTQVPRRLRRRHARASRASGAGHRSPPATPPPVARCGCARPARPPPTWAVP